ncbi:hypothetical protein TRFO_36513 [Tritrichomonas foetus]|uniref:Protein kinase domain-containing protein n=1 Tax=Tritrichomonas foetus TaxID=1144522 RepID=A0A1J4JID9_9EUKA|nr:hypothetical protein TRFO_36513 [Tritrichomonas foetus]|eukprot:OHS97315.1 hypothetical protein TRFO_36513 [Tritrichomonas foetus]
MNRVSPAVFAPFMTISRKMDLDDFRSRYSYVKIIKQTRNYTIRLANHVQTGELVAVKTILKSNMNSHKKVTDLFREIQNLISLRDHKNIIKLYEVVDVGDSFYMVMEYADNNDLCQYISKNVTISENKIRSFFRVMLKTISDLHQRNIVHRSMKIESFLLDSKLRIKLIDFSNSRTHKENDGLCTTISGTAQYEPPELIKGDPYDPKKLDSWTLGVIFYIMLFKEFPFNCPSLTETLQLILNSDIKIPKNKYSEEAIDLLHCLLCKDSARRITPTEALTHPFIGEEKAKFSNHKAKNDILHEKALSVMLCPKEQFFKLGPDDLVTYEIIKRKCQFNENLQKGQLSKKKTGETKNSPCENNSSSSSFSSSSASTNLEMIPRLLNGPNDARPIRRERLQRAQVKFSPHKRYSDVGFKPTFAGPLEEDEEDDFMKNSTNINRNSNFVNLDSPNLNKYENPLVSPSKQVTISVKLSNNEIFQPAFLKNEVFPSSPVHNIIAKPQIQNQEQFVGLPANRVVRSPINILRTTPNSCPNRSNYEQLRRKSLTRPLSPIAEQTKITNNNHAIKSPLTTIMKTICGFIQNSQNMSIVSREEFSVFVRFNELCACIIIGPVNDELNGYMINKINGNDSTLPIFEKLLSEGIGF